MHVPKASALFPLLHCLSALTNPIMHKNWYIKYLMLLTHPKQLLVFVKCALSRYTLKCALHDF